MSAISSSMPSPHFSIKQGQVSQTTLLGDSKEGSYQTVVDGLAGSVEGSSTSVTSQWGSRWLRPVSSVVVEDVDAEPRLDIELVNEGSQSYLLVSNGAADHGSLVEIPLPAGPYEQTEAFPSLDLPMKKIAYHQSGSKGRLVFNDGAVNYTIRRGLISQVD